MSIEMRIKAVIAEQLCVDHDVVTDDATFESLGADSLDHVEITLTMEDEFGIMISEDERDTLKTVRQAIEFVTQRAVA